MKKELYDRCKRHFEDMGLGEQWHAFLETWQELELASRLNKAWFDAASVPSFEAQVIEELLQMLDPDQLDDLDMMRDDSLDVFDEDVIAVEDAEWLSNPDFECGTRNPDGSDAERSTVRYMVHDSRRAELLLQKLIRNNERGLVPI